MGKGIFGRMFDMDGDGNLDVFEQALEFQAFSMIMDYQKKKKELKETESCIKKINFPKSGNC